MFALSSFHKNSATVAILLACFALGPNASAVTPAPDGGYPGGNTAEGSQALQNLTSGGLSNTGLGYQALFHNTSGDYNSGEGYRALYSNTTGSFNTATGVNALYSNTTGRYNEGNGVNALFKNTTGNNNAANGTQALFSNTTGSNNTGTGVVALFSNTTGIYNAANGCLALYNNTIGNFNTGDGANALFNNVDGTSNVAVGYQALYQNSSGSSNVAVGDGALMNNAAGTNNTALGTEAGLKLTGSNNIGIGSQAGADEGPSVDNVICIGTRGDTQAAGQVTPNRCYIANIHGVSLGGPAPYLQVMVDGDGQLGTATSSARFKKDIEPMDQASEGILKLKPVTFHYKDRDDKNDKTPQFGLIAEDVEKVNSDLVVYGKDGEVLSVRYDAVAVMLLNEFLKEHKKIERQRATIAELKSTIAQQQKQMQTVIARLKEQETKIQKVSAQVQLDKAAPQIAANRR